MLICDLEYSRINSKTVVMRSDGSRNTYYDFLRGVAILMVVGIHTYSIDYSSDGMFQNIIKLLLINWFNCAVPLFLAVSGYFIARKKLDTLDDCKAFWKKQISKVYIPCIIFSLPWFVISCLHVNTWGGVICRMVNLFFCGFSVYYFIALIIQCYLLAPILVRYNNVKTLVVVIFISLISTIVLEYYRFVQGVELPLFIRGSFPVLLVFFYIGIFLSKHSRDYSLWLPTGMMIVGLATGFSHMYYLKSHYDIVATGQKFSLYLFDIGFILLCMSKKCELSYKNSSFNRIILFIGEISFGIYFTHVYLIALADSFFPQLRGSWMMLWLFSLILTVAVVVTVKHIAPNYSNRYLGYR